MIMSKEAVEKYGADTFNAMNEGRNLTFSEIEPLGKQFKVHQKSTGGAGMPHNGRIDISPISLNLSGTIKLDLGNNQQIDITNALVNNSTFVSKMTDMISKQINIYTNDAYNKGKHKQKFV